MGKLVVLKFADGNFTQGFAVTVQIGDEGELPAVETTGKLPPARELPQYYIHWQSSYKRLGIPYRLEANTAQVTNVSVTKDCQTAAQSLRSRFNSWLQAEEFRPIREKLLEKLSPNDIIRIILQTENSELQRFPWHLWDLLERYPKAEIALASPRYERINQPRSPNPQVNILAIVGDSQGIDTQADKDLLQSLPDADVSLLVEPDRKELTDQIWGKNWDILFFAGHSTSQGDNCGRIYLNQNDSLSIAELKYALKTAVERGLQLAIFNSCDGLGLARELADLQIPQIIVMREPVPDQVAQEFLKNFLTALAQNTTLYLAVREARERLQGLENKFPCATWLPIICQNLSQTPVSWDELKLPVATVTKSSKPIARTLVSALIVTLIVALLRFFGVLESSELKAFDQMLWLRYLVITEKPDDRLLIITIDDNDLAMQRRNREDLGASSISEKSLNQLLVKLEEYQPRAIGLDIYRDFEIKTKELSNRLQNTQNLIAVCKGSDATAKTVGIAPPSGIPTERLGFSDFLHDQDGVVRRHLLFMNPEAASLCPASYALSVQLAFRYLAVQDILPKFNAQGELELGSTVFNNINSRTGGYQGIDANAGQILLNYRAVENIAQKVTLTEFLSGQINRNAIKDKIVLIGVVSKQDFPDYWATPYGDRFHNQMPGVMVHAHMTSQILSNVLNRRPLMKVWSGWIDFGWIFCWSVYGGLVVWFLDYSPRLIVGLGVGGLVLYVVCFGFCVQGYWVAFVPSVVALFGTVGVMYFEYLTQRR
jgi:CHASE2 domain-containing sensor protein